MFYRIYATILYHSSANRHLGVLISRSCKQCCTEYENPQYHFEKNDFFSEIYPGAGLLDHMLALLLIS